MLDDVTTPLPPSPPESNQNEVFLLEQIKQSIFTGTPLLYQVQLPIYLLS